MISGCPIVESHSLLVASRLMRWVIRLLGMPSIAVHLSFVTPSKVARVVVEASRAI
jgi:hypothetical protein